MDDTAQSPHSLIFNDARGTITMMAGLDAGSDTSLCFLGTSDDFGVMKADEAKILDWLRSPEPSTQEGQDWSGAAWQPAPRWRPDRLRIPGELAFTVEAPPGVVLDAFRTFLNEEVSAQQVSRQSYDATETSPWEMEVMVFMRYVPLSVHAYILDADDRTVIIFHELSRCDVVQFHHFSRLAANFFKVHGWQVSSGMSSDPSDPQDDCGGFMAEQWADDWSDEDDIGPEAWLDRLRPLVADACSPSTGQRENAVQVLARLAEENRICRPALAHAIAEKEEFLEYLAEGLEDDSRYPRELHARVSCVDFVRAGP